MRHRRRRVLQGRILLFGLAVLICPSLSASQQEGAITADQAIDKIIAKENELIKKLTEFRPLVETYIQNLAKDESLGAVPISDKYFLSRLDVKAGLRGQSLLDRPGEKKFHLNRTVVFEPDGFASMIVIDAKGFTRSNYTFRFLRREFLGDVRCLIFDIAPVKRQAGRFTGRIWVEDQDFNIVRFNGIHGPPPKLGDPLLWFHCDSWRQNAGPNLWLPSYVYSEETEDPKLNFKAQTRLWGYNVQKRTDLNEFTAVLVDSGTVRDAPEAVQDVSPLMATRAWQQQAEDNIIRRIEETGLFAAPGAVNTILETVIRNLEITNNLDVQPEVRTRVLLTSPLESFTIGHTIVISRGLIDVLPDEASLASVLAHELAHIVSGHNPNTKYAFSDSLLFDDVETLRKIFVRRDEREEAQADAKAAELLEKSPYKERLKDAGLFLRAMSDRIRFLPELLRPHLGNSMVRGSEVVRLAGIMQAAPEVELKRRDQIAALPLGARLRLNPWNNTISMASPTTAPLNSQREKMSFEITPVFLHLTRERGEESGLRDASKLP